MFHHFEFMLNANEIEIDYQRSFFCGDAAGRGAKKGKKKDYGELAFPSFSLSALPCLFSVDPSLTSKFCLVSVARSDLEFAGRAGLHFAYPEVRSFPSFAFLVPQSPASQASSLFASLLSSDHNTSCCSRPYLPLQSSLQTDGSRQTLLQDHPPFPHPARPHQTSRPHPLQRRDLDPDERSSYQSGWSGQGRG